MPRKKKEEENNTFKKSLKEELPRHLKGGLRKVIEREVILSPPVNIYENKDDYVLMFNIPGMKNGDIAVKVIDNELCIEEMKKEKEKKTIKKNILFEEIEGGRYFRKFKLTSEIDQKNISANLEDGVLNISLPKKKDENVEEKVEEKAEEKTVKKAKKKTSKKT